jgi:hypothetical protein
MMKKMIAAGIVAVLFVGCQTNSYERSLLKDLADTIAKSEDRTDSTISLYMTPVDPQSESPVAESMRQKDFPLVGRITIQSANAAAYNGYYVYSLMQRRWQTPTTNAYRDYIEAILKFAKPAEVYTKKE